MSARNDQSANRPTNRYHKSLWLAFWLNTAYLIVEVVGGVLTGSMALLSDAGHMMTDVGAIVMALFASYLAQKPRSHQKTYGYLRAEIIGALVNSIFLILICGYILLEAWQRTHTPQNILGGPVLIIATIGLLVNVGSALGLRKGKDHNLNLEGAYLHMIADALGSIAAMASGIVILLTGWTPIDTIASVVIALLILFGGWRLLMKSIDILMEGTPKEIDYQDVVDLLKSREHIISIHDLHIWTISSGILALSAHIEVTEECAQSGHWPQCLNAIQNQIKKSFGIEHTTLQTEPPRFREERDRDAL